MDEEGLQKTENELIYIGKPIVFDEKRFREQLEQLELAVKDETKNIRNQVKEIVPTYVMSQEQKISG